MAGEPLQIYAFQVTEGSDLGTLQPGNWACEQGNWALKQSLSSALKKKHLTRIMLACAKVSHTEAIRQAWGGSAGTHQHPQATGLHVEPPEQQEEQHDDIEIILHSLVSIFNSLSTIRRTDAQERGCCGAKSEASRPAGCGKSSPG